MARATRKTHLPAEYPARVEFAAGAASAGKARSLYREDAFERWLTLLGRMADPDEALRRLGVSRAYLTKLLIDDDITAALDTRREAVVGTPWRLEPGGTRAAKFVTEELAPVMEPLLNAVLNAVNFGYSVAEVVYAHRAGRVGIEKVSEKSFNPYTYAEWFTPQSDGTLLWHSEQNPQGELTDPRKFLLTVHRPTYHNPRGEALLSRLYWPWYFRQNGWKFWARWLERFGSPYLVGETQGDHVALAEQLESALNGAIIALGGGATLKALETSGTGEQFDKFERAIITRYERLILGQTLTSDVGASGSYAAAKVHNEVRADKRNADLRLARNRLQYVVNTLWVLNGFTGAPAEFVMADDTGLEADRADRDTKLVNAGVLKLTKEYLLDRYDYRPGDFEIVEQAEPETLLPQGPNPVVGEPVEEGMAATPPQRFTPEQEVVEGLGDDAMREAGPYPVSLDAVRSAIFGAKDDSDLADRLAVLLDEQDPQFADVLARAQFTGAVLGYVHASEPSTER